MTWFQRDDIAPAFDAPLTKMKYISGGVYVVKTKQQRNNIKAAYRKFEDTERTLVAVTDLKKIYVLINNPGTDFTADADWEDYFQIDSPLTPIGSWEADNTNPVLADTGAVGMNGQFYFVTGAPSGVGFQDPLLFGGAAVTVYDNDWIMSVGNEWVHLRITTTWESLNRPQSIIDYENGIVQAHTHPISDVLNLQTELDSKFDSSDVADSGIDWGSVPNNALADKLFLSTHYYRNIEVYSQSEVDALIIGSTFRTLPDTPSTFVGSSLKLARVNIGEDAIEFVDGTTLYSAIGHTHVKAQISDFVETDYWSTATGATLTGDATIDGASNDIIFQNTELLAQTTVAGLSFLQMDNIAVAAILTANGTDIGSLTLNDGGSTIIQLGGASAPYINHALGFGVGTTSPDPDSDFHVSGSKAIIISVGTNSRPTAAQGMIRLNTDLDGFEGYTGPTSGWQAFGATAGTTSFIALTDTPAVYAGSESYFVKVNAGGDAIEFVASGGGGGSPAGSVEGAMQYRNAAGDDFDADDNLFYDNTGSFLIAPNFKIGGTVAQDNSLTKIAVIDDTTGQIKYRDISTVTGNFWLSDGNTTIITDVAVEAATNNITIRSGSGVLFSDMQVTTSGYSIGRSSAATGEYSTISGDLNSLTLAINTNNSDGKFSLDTFAQSTWEHIGTIPAAHHSRLVHTASGITYTSDIDGFGTKGFVGYGSDHSSTYTDRSWIDKGFADATYELIGGGGGWPLTGTAALTGATTINTGTNTLLIRTNIAAPPTQKHGIELTNAGVALFSVANTKTTHYIESTASGINIGTLAPGALGTDDKLVVWDELTKSVQAFSQDGLSTVYALIGGNSIQPGTTSVNGAIQLNSGVGSTWSVTNNAQTEGFTVSNETGGGKAVFFTTNTIFAFEDSTANPEKVHFTDNRVGAAAVGIEYTGDYSANYSARSLIDKGFADSSYWKVVGNTDLPIDGTVNIQSQGASGLLQIGHEHTFPPGADWNKIQFSAGQILVHGATGFAGLEYNADYSSNFVDRSLADWGNVWKGFGTTTLTGDVIIDGTNSDYKITIQSGEITSPGFANIVLDPSAIGDNPGFFATAIDGSFPATVSQSTIELMADSTTWGTAVVVTSQDASGTKFTSHYGQDGVWKYDVDTSASYDARSLVDVEFIEGGGAAQLDRVGLNLTTGDVATPTEGQIWYNNTTNKFRAFENAAAVDMIGGGGSQTPWTSNIAGAGFYLSNVPTIRDSNLNEVVGFASVASAVNYVEITNATAASPEVGIAAVGDSTSIRLLLASKGAASIKMAMNSLEVFEFTDRGNLLIKDAAGATSTATGFATLRWNETTFESFEIINGTNSQELDINLGTALVSLSTNNADSTFRISGKGAGNLDLISGITGIIKLNNSTEFSDKSATAIERIGLTLTTGDVTTPVEGQIWYNNTTNKFRAFENAAAVDMISAAGGGEANTISSLGGGIALVAGTPKSGVNLQTVSISATGGSGIVVSSGSDLITIDFSAADLGVTTMVGADWIVFNDAGTSSRALISTIPLSLFNDDLGHVENVVGNLGFTVGTGEITTTNGTNITIGSFGTTNTDYGFVIGSNSVGATFYLDATGTWSVPAGGSASDSFKTWNFPADSGFTWAGTDVVADSPTDTMKLVAGTNITIESDAASDAIRITASGGGTPGGADTQIQYNNVGAFGGEANFTYNDTTKLITVSLNDALDDDFTAFRIYHSDTGAPGIGKGVTMDFVVEGTSDATMTVGARLATLSTGLSFIVENGVNDVMEITDTSTRAVISIGDGAAKYANYTTSDFAIVIGQSAGIGTGKTTIVSSGVFIGKNAGAISGNHPTFSDSIHIGNWVGNVNSNIGRDSISLIAGQPSSAGLDVSGQDSIVIGSVLIKASAAGAQAYGTGSVASGTGSIMMGYHTSAQTNSVINTFEVSWTGVRGFKAGPLFGTQVTNNADPNTNLTASESGSLAFDTTSNELQIDVGTSWEVIPSTLYGANVIVNRAGFNMAYTNESAIINTLVTSMLFEELSSGTVAAGFGGKISFDLENASNISAERGYWGVRLDVATSGSEDVSHVWSADVAGTPTIVGELSGAGLVLATNTQTIQTVTLTLTQAQIQSLNTVPITVVAAPGSGKYIQLIGASAQLNHVTTAFTGGTALELAIATGTSNTFKSIASFIDNGANLIKHFDENSAGATITTNAALNVTADADSTGGGTSTIDIYVQYVIIDTN